MLGIARRQQRCEHRLALLSGRLGPPTPEPVAGVLRVLVNVRDDLRAGVRREVHTRGRGLLSLTCLADAGQIACDIGVGLGRAFEHRQSVLGACGLVKLCDQPVIDAEIGVRLQPTSKLAGHLFQAVRTIECDDLLGPDHIRRIGRARQRRIQQPPGVVRTGGGKFFEEGAALLQVRMVLGRKRLSHCLDRLQHRRIELRAFDEGGQPGRPLCLTLRVIGEARQAGRNDVSLQSTRSMALKLLHGATMAGSQRSREGFVGERKSRLFNPHRRWRFNHGAMVILRQAAGPKVRRSASRSSFGGYHRHLPRGRPPSGLTSADSP
ncbi:hypothetical protein [Roseateles depolymerans]|uniref:hypothetical protein n=1 Tax=Roseateles depolymerans TaxID=76731 RepID=UPI001475A548|nr:hypothetical protein [Roseateles depolymerans]